MKKCGLCVYFSPKHWGSGICSFFGKWVVADSETTAGKCGHFAFDPRKYIESEEGKNGRPRMEKV